MIEQSSLYRKNYGPHYRPVSPDYALCCESVHDQGRWPSFHQCTRKRGHGPDGAYCKQHDPQAAKARQDAAAARSRETWNKRRYEWYGKSFFDALVKIAEGHNDARGLAQEVVDAFRKGAS